MDYTKRVMSLFPTLNAYKPGWATYAPLLTAGPCPCGRDEAPTVEAAAVALGRLPECAYCGCVPLSPVKVAEVLRTVATVAALPPNPRFFYEGQPVVYTLCPETRVVVESLPVGPIDDHPGWMAVGPINGPAWGLSHNGLLLARVTARGLSVTPASTAKAGREAARASNRAHCDAYEGALAHAVGGADFAVIHCLLTASGWMGPAVPPAEQGAARAALAMAGWIHSPGQEGGFVLAPGATVPVSVKGICRRWVAGRLTQRCPGDQDANAVWAAATKGAPVDPATVVRHRESLAYAITSMGGVEIEVVPTVTEMGLTRPARDDDDEADWDPNATLRLAMWGAAVASWPVVVTDGKVLTGL